MMKRRHVDNGIDVGLVAFWIAFVILAVMFG